MKLITKTIDAAFTRQGDLSQKQANEIKIICKLFGGSSFTWHFYDRDKVNPDIFYCFANLGDPQMAECGAVSLKELESLRFPPLNLGVERDLFFEIGSKTLEQVIRETKGI